MTAACLAPPFRSAAHHQARDPRHPHQRSDTRELTPPDPSLCPLHVRAPRATLPGFMSHAALDAAIDGLVQKALDATNHDRITWTKVTPDHYFVEFPQAGRLTIRFEAGHEVAQVRLTVASPRIEPYDATGQVLSYFTAPGGPGDLRGPITRPEVVGRAQARIVELFDAVEDQPIRLAERAAELAEEPGLQALTDTVEAIGRAL